LFATISVSYAQQSKEKQLAALEQQCMKALPPGSVFLKGYPASVGESKQWVEYSVSLQAGSKYAFSVADLDEGTAKGAVVFIYDKKQHKMATNYHNDKIFTNFEFQCQATGIYKLFIAFKDSTEHLAYVVMASK
jgi:hypothetical protein